METASLKAENAEEGAVGVELCIDLDRHPMTWMRNHQRCYDDEMKLLAITLPTDRWERNCHTVSGASPAINVALVLHHTPHILPSHPNHYGDQAMATSRSGGK